MTVFSKTKALIGSVIEGQEELLGDLGRLTVKLDEIATRFDRLVRMHEEALAAARGRESAIDTLLIERARESRATTNKIEAELKEREETKPSEYDRKF